ncbi:MAG: phosphoribosylamine--glycine ligase [Chthoniobacterales bacterium]|nr:phosphoribosylamine--glycine ligase [Chthoniobacterales bacterium]
MNILIVGSGGREHALAWKLAQSPRVSKIFCAPGNGGTARLGENVPLAADNISGLVEFAKTRKIGLTVVGPDDALALGLVDAFDAAGLKIFGPTASAARLESSKSFAKDFMNRHGIPTARAREFTDSASACEWCRTSKFPLVIKADGLALGKGVVIAMTVAEAEHAVRQCLDEEAFGEAGRRIVIEEFLEGVECSIHALVDGASYLLFPDCRDHKRACDGDKGPNTGGMGTISPSGSLDECLRAQVKREILDRFIAGLKKDGIEYRGMLFPGLMLTADGPKVLEFNCRWGDPETQVLVRRLGSDLLDLLEATVEGTLSTATPEWREAAATCVILASGGYPGSYEKGKIITGIASAETLPDVVVFHAGTKDAGETLQTNGGRVLGVTALGDHLPEARQKAYEAADRIAFEGLQRRNDIGPAGNS